MIHNFRERLNFSEGVELSLSAEEKMLSMIPAATGVRRANVQDDRTGVDYWIDRENGLPSIGVDVKHRSFCPIQRFGSDDACIETTSVYDIEPEGRILNAHRIKPGWTVDTKKRTDLIMYTWPLNSGIRFWVLYFPFLCQASRINWKKWLSIYPERAAQNENYWTLSIYPPRVEIARAMREMIT